MSTAERDWQVEAHTPEQERYLRMQQDPEFQELRRRYRGWVLPVTLAALVWYFAYVLLAAYAEDFMGNKLVGNITVGLVLGLLQFVSTFGITALYIRHADRVLDPVSTRLREQYDTDVARTPGATRGGQH